MNSANPESSARFTPEIEAKLIKAGWYPHRLVDEPVTDEWCALPFESAHLMGYHLLFPAAYHFLREFGELTIGPAVFLPAEVDIDLANLIFYEWVLETRLYPLGVFTSQPYYYLMIDLSGKVWAETEGFSLIGNNTDEAITNLLTNKRPQIRIDIGEAGNVTRGYIASRVEDALRARLKP